MKLITDDWKCVSALMTLRNSDYDQIENWYETRVRFWSYILQIILHVILEILYVLTQTMTKSSVWPCVPVFIWVKMHTRTRLQCFWCSSSQELCCVSLPCLFLTFPVCISTVIYLIKGKMCKKKTKHVQLAAMAKWLWNSGLLQTTKLSSHYNTQQNFIYNLITYINSLWWTSILKLLCTVTRSY